MLSEVSDGSSVILTDSLAFVVSSESPDPKPRHLLLLMLSRFKASTPRGALISTRLSPLIYLVSFHIVFSLTFIILFHWFFQYGRKMVLAHLLLVVGLVFGSIGFTTSLVSIGRFRKWNGARLIISAT